MELLKVEVFLKQGKVRSFLEDLITLCDKHQVFIESSTGSTEIKFYNWDDFTALEVDSEGASLYWPRIQTDIVVQRKGK
jgi:hypothetical protein